MERKEIDMVTYRAAVASCPRKSGDHNEDNFYFNSKFITEELASSQVILAHKKSQNGVQMYAVTDGNMAESYADEISLMLVRGLKKYHAKLIENSDLNAFDVIDEYNREAYAAAKRRSLANEKRPLSSLGLMAVNGDSLVFSNAGNVRIYRIRDGVAELFSVDHTQAQKMVELGLMTSEKAATHPQRKKLTQFFGVMPEEVSFKPVMFEEKAEAGDLYVLCTSGCYENVSALRMVEINDESDSVADFVKTVFAEAATEGCREDITVLAVKVEIQNVAAVPVGVVPSDSVSAHSDGLNESAETVGAAATATAVVSAKKSGSSGPISNAEKKAQRAEKNAAAKKGETDKPVSFMTSIKAFLGIGNGEDGENNEKIWPALLVFVICLILIIVLTVYGINVYNSSKQKTPAPGYTPFGTSVSDETSSQSTDSSTETPLINNSSAPTDTGATLAPESTVNINTVPNATTGSETVTPETETPVATTPVVTTPAATTPAPTTPAATTPVATTPAVTTPAATTPAPTTASPAPTATAEPTVAVTATPTLTPTPTPTEIQGDSTGSESSGGTGTEGTEGSDNTDNTEGTEGSDNGTDGEAGNDSATDTDNVTE